MNPYYVPVAQRAGHRCEYCRAPEVIFNFPFEVEHIIPPGKGGTGAQSNLALSCRSCNLFKADQTEAVDPETAKTVPLFNPRLERWGEHFALDKATAMLVGLTSVGRASIHFLRMNRVTQLAARAQWMRLRLYP
jgi:hypothetical protein